MRHLTSHEAQILNRMLDQLPTDQNILADQAELAKVSKIDEEGSLRFSLPDNVMRANSITERVPVTARFDDDDGMPVYLLLHLIGGKLWELEVYKADGSQIISPPAADKLQF